MGNHCLTTEYTPKPRKQRGCSQAEQRAYIMSGGAIPMSEMDIAAQNRVLALKNQCIPKTAVSIQPEQLDTLLSGISDDTLIPQIFLTPYNLKIEKDNVTKCYNPVTHSVFVNGEWTAISKEIPFDYSMVSHKFVTHPGSPKTSETSESEDEDESDS